MRNHLIHVGYRYLKLFFKINPKWYRLSPYLGCNYSVDIALHMLNGIIFNIPSSSSPFSIIFLPHHTQRAHNYSQLWWQVNVENDKKKPQISDLITGGRFSSSSSSFLNYDDFLGGG